ncbi:MAG: kelch repeat-containing protein [Planctomycetota bacterium]
MRPIVTIVITTLTAYAALPQATAQSWTASPATPTVAFGALGDLLGRVPTGLVGFDELQGGTVLPLSGGWVTLNSAVPARQFSTFGNHNVHAFVFGGLDAVSGLRLNDVWRFEPTLGDWQQLTAGGVGAPGPSPRLGCKAAPIDDSWLLVFFGGSDANGLCGDTWVMMPTSSSPTPPFWVQQTTPAALTPRLGHAMARAPGGNLILFGGDDGVPRGDTWLFGVNGWTAHTGLGPAPATECRMTYDRGRDLTVLVHPDGSTWEWNGFAWRQVGASGAPAWNFPALVYTGSSTAVGEVIAVQQDATATGTVVWHYTPSPARFDLTLDATCNVPGYPPLELSTWQRSLPILGQAFHLRVTGVPPTSLTVGAVELASPFPIYAPLGCNCATTLLGVDVVAMLVTGGPGPRDWLLPIPAAPQLIDVPLATQVFVVDAANPCWLMTTQVGEFACGL